MDPFDTTMINMTTKEGRTLWFYITKPPNDWTPCAVTVSNAELILDLFKDKCVSYGLDDVLNVPTTVTGKEAPLPREVAGIYYWNTDLSWEQSLLTKLHHFLVTQVRTFSKWVIGGEGSELKVSNDMAIKAINPSKAGNIGLVNQRKIRL